ncbi:hypothetical protein PMAYCL1PPCAC_14251, partial [Pristionchus mayeri]
FQNRNFENMTDETSGNQEFSCVQALGAAITDSAKVPDSTGVPLRRSLAEFVTFTSRLEDEMEASTPEQLECTLKSINNFHRALSATRASLERIVQVGKERYEEDEIDNAMFAPKEELIDALLFNQGDEQPFGPDFAGEEIKEEAILNDEMASYHIEKRIMFINILLETHFNLLFLVEPKEEPFDVPLWDGGQKFGSDFNGDEMEFKDGQMRNEDVVCRF